MAASDYVQTARGFINGWGFVWVESTAMLLMCPQEEGGFPPSPYVIKGGLGTVSQQYCGVLHSHAWHCVSCWPGYWPR
jgi:hypothetical protein